MGSASDPRIVFRFSRQIARTFKFHPDTVFQLCMQLAYTRIHGIDHPASVYETATTRKFCCGRTETIRSCTIEAVAWMRAITELGPENSKWDMFMCICIGAYRGMSQLVNSESPIINRKLSIFV